MEKWKILVIVGLLAAIPVYGYLQNRPVTTPATPEVPVGTPEAPPPVKQLVGKPALPWNFPAANWANTPKPLTLKDLKGNVTLLEFWRAECKHCQEAAPFMEKLHTTLGPKGLKIVTFHSSTTTDPTNVEFSWPKVQGRIKELKITYPVAFDKGAQLFKQYSGKKFPTVILLDKQGNVVYADHGHTSEKQYALMQALGKELSLGTMPPPKSAAVPDSSAVH